MDSRNSVAHTRHVAAAEGLLSTVPPQDLEPPDPWNRLSPDPANQAQILRSHQRDTAQVSRLTELVSELLRSIAGTRWLAHRQTFIDLAVRAAYLLLTFGRGRQTLGEEYTDVLPNVLSRQRPPSRKRRLLTILLLLLPTAVTSPSALNYLRGHQGDASHSRWARFKSGLVRFLESPLGQSLPEIHLVWFLFGGRFYEFARRLTGVGYISDLAPRPPEHRAPTYEPLGFLMALPLLYRLFPRPSASTSSGALPHTTVLQKDTRAEPGPTPVPAPEDSVVVTATTDYDAPNTYLTPEARELPERQCTLCLEPHGTGEGSGGTTAVTECGHIFCWGCLGGLDKMECPLCRQALRMERLVAAYNL